MTVLITGLYVEGHTDQLVLPELVQRIIQRIVDARKRYNVDVLRPYLLNDEIDAKPHGFVNCVLEAARFASGYHMIILHRDADHAKPDKAMKQYILPACTRVQREHDNGGKVCHNIVPLIPIRETEAWLLTDPEALIDALRLKAKPEQLGLPVHGYQIESIKDPKQTVNQIVLRFAPGTEVQKFMSTLPKRSASRVWRD